MASKGKSELEWTLPPLSKSNPLGTAERLFTVLLFACSNKTTPSRALQHIRKAHGWASKIVREDVFRLLFDIDRTFGGFCSIWFKMNQFYFVPVVDRLELNADAKAGYTPSILDAMLCLIQKISLTLIALDCIKKKRTGRPLKHMLPTDATEKNRCRDLHDVIVCVWTRMCHVWGNVQDESDTFVCREISCFSIDGQSRPPYVWFDVDADERTCTMMGNSYTAEQMKSVRVYLWPDKDWITFSTETNEEVLETECVKNMQFFTIMFHEEDTNPEVPFKIMPGNMPGLDCFILITTHRGTFHGFYKMHGKLVLRHPILLHPMIKDLVGSTPRDGEFIDISLQSCTACGFEMEAYIKGEQGTYCSEKCALQSELDSEEGAEVRVKGR